MTAQTLSGRHRRLHTVLPTPPVDEEVNIYADHDRLYVASLDIIAFASKVAAQVYLELHVPLGWFLAPLTILYVTYQVSNMCTNLRGPGFDFSAHAARVASWQPRRWPTVDIFLPVCGEPVSILANTWESVSALIRAYPGLARGYVLDDGPDAGLKLVAAEYGLSYFRRPKPGEHKKAGNLRWAFDRTDGEHIVVFDADFTPSPRFLAETLPYMDDLRIGILQTPQYFRAHARQTWVERAGGCAQEVFYRCIQVARDRIDSALCVGTNAVYRRAAMAPIGGFTLIPYAEDAHTGLDTLLRGFKIRYIPVVLASGMCPATLSGFIHQQYRWSNGSVSIVFTERLWRVPMGFWARQPYINGFMWNLWTAVEVMVGPLVPVFILLFEPGIVRLQNFMIVVPALLAGMLNFPLWHKTGYGPRTWPIVIATGWAQAISLWDYARGKVMSWQPTGGRTDSVRGFRLGVRWNALLAAAWLALAAWREVQQHNVGFLVVAVFGLLYAVLLACVIFTDWKETT